MLNKYLKRNLISFLATDDEKKRLDYFTKKHHISRSELLRGMCLALNMDAKFQRPDPRKSWYVQFCKLNTRLTDIKSILEDLRDTDDSDKVHAVVFNAINDVNNVGNEINSIEFDAINAELRRDGHALDKVVDHKQDFKHNKQLLSKLDTTQKLLKKIQGQIGDEH